MAAIRADDQHAVAAVLEEDPLAAGRPLREGGRNPALAAIREGCSPRLLGLLLKCGAEPDAKPGLVGVVPPLEAVVCSRVPTTIPQIIYRELVGTTAIRAMEQLVYRLALHLFAEIRCCRYAAWLLRYGAQPQRRLAPRDRRLALLEILVDDGALGAALRLV